MGADDKSSGLVQGTLYMLILKTLALEPMHGYGIGLRLEQISRGVFQVNARVPLDITTAGPKKIAVKVGTGSTQDNVTVYIQP